MSKIIFLNGCGSAGKTSIARAIQYLSKDSWLTFGIDTFISMIPIAIINTVYLSSLYT
ncbi:phosphotransferase-like protein [Candidatus Tisiphia endosymbiont of Metellina segmentata]|uniref:phosphotransferase-like protein n=1 Tax=Candidatus Tisiphia endosymbiont of Metellina segmentata TaxID=3066274 RepID=UPI00397781E1